MDVAKAVVFEAFSHAVRIKKRRDNKIMILVTYMRREKYRML